MERKLKLLDDKNSKKDHKKDWNIDIGDLQWHIRNVPTFGNRLYLYLESLKLDLTEETEKARNPKTNQIEMSGRHVSISNSSEKKFIGISSMEKVRMLQLLEIIATDNQRPELWDSICNYIDLEVKQKILTG